MERCCKHTLFEGENFCLNSANCADSCFDLGDCSATERCDISKNLCTTTCSSSGQCHQGYICDEGHCVSSGSALNITTLIAVFVGVGAFLFLICCCVRQKRPSRNAFTNRASGGTTPRQNEEVGRLPTSSNLQGNDESGGQILDPIAESGPPSYNEVSTQPESPPPTYEQVMSAFTWDPASNCTQAASLRVSLKHVMGGSVLKVPMKWKIICAYLKGLSKCRRIAYFFSKYLFPF